MTDHKTSDHARRNARTHRRRHAEPKFYRTLARFAGFCGICNTSYTVGDPIYWCPKTPTTRTMRVHQHCYLQKCRAFAPACTPARSEPVVEPTRRPVTVRDRKPPSAEPPVQRFTSESEPFNE